MGELGSMSIIEHMSDGYPQVDRILVAQLTGEARFHVRWRELSADEQAAAVVALRELANGWADLLPGRWREPGGSPEMDRRGVAA
jgi:Lon protease-like protein